TITKRLDPDPRMREIKDINRGKKRKYDHEQSPDRIDEVGEDYDAPGPRNARSLSSRRACAKATRSASSELEASSSSDARKRARRALSSAMWLPTCDSCKRDSTMSA